MDNKDAKQMPTRYPQLDVSEFTALSVGKNGIAFGADAEDVYRLLREHATRSNSHNVLVLVAALEGFLAAYRKRNPHAMELASSVAEAALNQVPHG